MFSYTFRSLSAVFTALYLFVSVGACSVPLEEDALSPSLGISLGYSSRSVNILQSMPEASLALQQAADRYAEAAESPLSFHIQTVSGADYRSTLRSKLLAGEDVDLFHLQDASDIDRLQPYLEDLSPLPWVSGAVDGTLDAVAVGDAVYGVPHSLEGIGLICNRGIFEAAGIPLSEIHDFASLSEAFLALRGQIDAGELREDFPDLAAVADIAAQDTEYLSGTVAELLLSGSFASPSQAHRAPGVQFPDAGRAESFIKLLAQTSPQRADWKVFPNVTRQQMVEGGLAAERVAVILSTTEVYRHIYAANPAMEGKLALLPVHYEDTEQGIVFTGPPAWWGVRADADDAVKRQAEGFLTWLYQSEEGCAVLAQELGVLSPYRETAVSTGIALHRQLLDSIDAGLDQPRLASEAPTGWGSVFAEQLRQYFTVYDKTWAELEQACAEEWAGLAR